MREQEHAGPPFAIDARDNLVAIVAPWRIPIRLEVGSDENGYEVIARAQRGGIHSDPLIRLLACRAWGDRDRRWRRRDTARVRLGEYDMDLIHRLYGFDDIDVLRPLGVPGAKRTIRWQAQRGDARATVDIPASVVGERGEALIDALDEDGRVRSALLGARSMLGVEAGPGRRWAGTRAPL